MGDSGCRADPYQCCRGECRGVFHPGAVCSEGNSKIGKKDTFSEQEDMSRTRAESKGAGHIFMFSKTKNQHWQSYDFHRNFCNTINKNAYGLFQMDVVR